MKSYRTKYIIIICISLAVTVISLTALLLLLLAFKAKSDVASVILFLLTITGVTVLLCTWLLYVVKKQQVKRSELVLERYKNLGNVIYVQGICGNKSQDKKDGAKNAAAVAGMVAFATLFGVGVSRTASSRKRTEFFISESDIYESEITQSAFVGFNYAPVDAMKPVYKAPFARHTLTKNGRRVILTSADGQDYITFDLNTCSTSGENLLAALENVLQNTEDINREL